MADMKVESYLFFGGRCEEAMEFYREAVGAEVLMAVRYDEAPEPPPPGMLAEGFERKVMHASLRIGATRIMASDGCEPDASGFKGFSLALAVKTEGEADRVFAGLSEGGEVTMPLCKTFWSPRFGMLRDKFGVGWMVNVKEEEGG